MRAVRALVAALACARLGGCGEDPSSASSSSERGRTSMAGRAMDRAEDLKKEVDNYNRAIEDTIAQGTGDAPPSAANPAQKPAPKRKPSGPASGTP